MSDLMIRVDGNQIKQVLLGGSYLDTAETGACTARKPPTPAWNATDPNIPKSPWWLADGSFIGFRVVCDVGPAPVRDAASHGDGRTRPLWRGPAERRGEAHGSRAPHDLPAAWFSHPRCRFRRDRSRSW